MKDFLESRSARAGLTILALIGFLALFGPLIVPWPEASTRWRDISYWEDSPAGAPPMWTNGPWNGWDAPASRHVAAGAPLLREGSSGRLLTWTFALDRGAAGDGAAAASASAGAPEGRPPVPEDLVLRLPGGRGRVFLLVREGRADAPGRELFRGERDLVPDGSLRLALPGVTASAISATLYLATGLSRPGDATVFIVGKTAGLLGTDADKRDVFTGLVLGIRWALLLGVIVSFLTVLSGLLLGTFAACYGGIFGSITNRVYEFFSMMPLLPFLVAVSAIHKPSLWSFAGLALLFYWTRTFKTVYARALQIKSEGHIEAAVLVGAGRWWRVTRHVLPELLPYAFAMMAMSVPGIIIAEAGVSLLGLGDTNTVTWGQMLHDALVQGAVINGMWWWILPPGLAIALMGLSFALVGRGLDRVVNPRMKGY